MASGLFGMGLVLGPTLGPTLGGYLIDNYSWPLIFTINIPIGIIATLLSVSFIGRKEGEGKRKDEIKIDYTGIGLLMMGIPASSAQAAFSQVPQAGKLKALMCTATPSRGTQRCTPA